MAFFFSKWDKSGKLDYYFGHLDTALEKLLKCHHVFLETNNVQYLCNNAIFITLVLIEQQNFTDLNTILEVTKQTCEPVFLVPSHFYALIEGIANMHQGNLSAAHQHMDKIMEALEHSPAPMLKPVYLIAVANLAAEDNQWELAWQRYRFADDNIGELHPLFQTLNLRDWGHAHLERSEDGDQARAAGLLQKALEIFATMGAHGWVRMLEEELAGTEK